MSRYKPQTSDPGENHSNASKNTGVFDFGGQAARDTGNGDGANTEVKVRVRNTSNKFNGSGGSKKIIKPHKVKGIHP